jgi:RNA polymerase sigma-70 factor (ECF subfamily)
MTDQTLSQFEEHRSLPVGIAYRLLGSVTDAQDMIQESDLRWPQAADDAIQSPRAWLTTAVTRLCINHLQLARVKREIYVGPWLPEPLADEPAGDPAAAAESADSLSFAFLVLLETLSPPERAVFILREGFDDEFSDVARIVEKSEANCRQILARARKRIDARRPRYDVSRADADKLIAPFVAAVQSGDLETLIASMSDNVVLVSDAGGKPGALRRPIHGPGPIARVLVNVLRKLGSATDEVHRATINGLPGFVRFQDGRAQGVLAFGIAGGRIEALFSISNPDKLRPLDR